LILKTYFAMTDLWLASNAAVGIIGMIAAAGEGGAASNWRITSW